MMESEEDAARPHHSQRRPRKEGFLLAEEENHFSGADKNSSSQAKDLSEILEKTCPHVIWKVQKVHRGRLEASLDLL